MPEGEEDGRKVASEVAALLAMPFEEAIMAFDPLRRYIETNEDPEALKEEFRTHWHEDAPETLRQVLEELVDEDAAAATAAAVQAFQKDPLSADAGPAMGGLGCEPGVQRHALLRDREMQLQSAASVEKSGRPLRARLPAAEEAEEEDADGENDVELVVKVNRLLALDFKHALAQSEELRRYVRDREDASEVEQEFKQHWGPEAPKALRDELEEILWPALVAGSSGAAEPFLADDSKETSGESHRVRPPAAEEVEEEEADDENSVELTVEVDRLLALDFKDAMGQSEELRRYVRDREDVLEVEQEFQQHWGPEAPKALRDVLEEILWPALAVSSCVAFEPRPATDSEETSGEPPRARLAVAEEVEEEEADDENDVELAVAVDKFLALDFKEAMAQSEELRRYVRDHEDAEEVEQEFEQHWGPEAPKALREVLEDVIRTALVAAQRQVPEGAPRSKL